MSPSGRCVFYPSVVPYFNFGTEWSVEATHFHLYARAKHVFSEALRAFQFLGRVHRQLARENEVEEFKKKLNEGYSKYRGVTGYLGGIERGVCHKGRFWGIWYVSCTWILSRPSGLIDL
jgi:hypothetical protein